MTHLHLIRNGKEYFAGYGLNVMLEIVPRYTIDRTKAAAFPPRVARRIARRHVGTTEPQ